MRIDFHGITAGPEIFGDWAEEAEELGYDSIWMSETQHDPFVGLTAAALRTSRPAIRTGLAVVFARNPMTTAMLANDLQLVSGGRFALGIGSQLQTHITKRFNMPWSNPAPRMREYILALRAIWECFATDGRLRFRGEFYRHTLMSPFFNPGPNPYGPPPILLAGVGPMMTRVAGELADGFLAHIMTTRELLEGVTLPALRAAREAVGKSMDGFEIHVTPIVAVTDDERELHAAIRRAKESIAYYASIPSYAPVLELHGLGGLKDELYRLAGSGRAAEMPDAIDDSVLETFAIVGGSKEAAIKIYERFGGLATSVAFFQSIERSPEEIQPLHEALRRQVS
ncbi:TIGR03617 family F420-dependent LLM class oxidoreductase [Planotetraspora sp. A-T 1434]|uniref:TIGR03617 family F420-dependent LLM class oxidoreductase n=1 Tax=Planotetraspora sp. A-T 1434 TaxID=2979219 RepID=UPI0021C20BD7|nr:TIGR03617 family F420-dependent LLM class oxidoreductase [Planotetraspora sp. A-T 1434]MCT9930508.1 TIGR03617 family F420-dependent LLM class oxidoreductase [Planotetraspora sp. A-T 1434]